MSPGELRLFRYVPGDTPAHRMWAGTKLVAVAVLGIAAGVKASWSAAGVLAAVLAAYVAVARLPRGVLPRVPRWVWIGVGIVALESSVAGGAPVVHVGGVGVGLGGLLDWLRFMVLGTLVLGMGALVGWTTPLADLAAAVDRLAAPARVVRLPVDEVVVTVGLAVRCLPLLGDELRTLRAALRVRTPEQPPGLRWRTRAARGLVTAGLVSSLRRASEMADAMHARGGARRPVRAPVRVGVPDVVAIALVAAAAAAMVRA